MTAPSIPPAPRRRASGGRVVFVGAGPGDPRLMTVRAVDLLRHSDVVVYDTLVPQPVLDLIPGGVERLAVPRDSREGDCDQGEATGRLLLGLANAGRIVTRLKGGDPGVFGRLSEELAPLREAGIPVDIVPGVTAAAAAAAAAGIPLTSRQAASSLTIVTGHEAAAKPDGIDFASLASLSGTLAIYMGVEQVERWSRGLIAAGKPSDTPVAIVSRCSWPDQRIGTSTLARCAADFARHHWPAPAVVFVGDVAQPWCGAAGPLAGRRVLNTRPLARGDAFDALVRAAGGSCVHVPMIRIGPPPSWEPLDEAIRQADTFDWIVFASAHGVEGFIARLRAAGLDARALGTARIAAIGPATAAELERAGFACDLVPAVARSEGIVAALGGMAGAGRFLLVRANRGRDLMRRELEARGHDVTEVAAYASEPVAEIGPSLRTALEEPPIDWVTVTSSLIAEATVRHCGPWLSRWRIASLSPVTSATLRRHGFEPTVEAAEAAGESLVDAMADWEAAHAARFS